MTLSCFCIIFRYYFYNESNRSSSIGFLLHCNVQLHCAVGLQLGGRSYLLLLLELSPNKAQENIQHHLSYHNSLQRIRLYLDRSRLVKVDSLWKHQHSLEAALILAYFDSLPQYCEHWGKIGHSMVHLQWEQKRAPLQPAQAGIGRQEPRTLLRI